MEYNKNRFQKTNDKKVLHKVKKQWVVLSMSLLAAIGGGALASHVTTHADTTNNNNQTHVQASTLQGRLNHNLIQSRQFNQQNQAQAPKTNSQAITQQANVLHNRIVNNTVAQHLNQSQAKKNVNPNQGSVLQKRIDANAAQVGGTEATGSVANFVDNEVANNNDQPSVVGSISASAGTTYGDLASNVPSGYLLDALAPGTNMNTPVTFTSKSADIEVSKKKNNNLTANNLPYEIDYNNSNGQPQQTYSAGQSTSLTSNDVDQSGWTASAGASSSVNASNAAGFLHINLPSGYKMSGGSYIATMTPTGIQWTDDNTGKVVASPKFTAVPKTSASAITVHLIDHSGYQVPLSGTTGITSAANAGYSATLSNGDLVFNGTGDFGNTIDALPSAINQNLPSGYSLASSQYSDYTFGSTAQTVNAMVNAPKASNASVNIKLMNYNHEGSGSQSASSSYKLQDLVNSGKASVNDSDVKEGDIVTINPGTFASSGYNATGSDYTSYEDDRVYVGDNGDVYQASLNSAGGTAPSTAESNPIIFNYSENDTTASSGDLPTVTVTYVNQNGSTITSSASANIQTSDYGKTIDLTSPENGVALPQGYQLNYSLDDNDATKFTVNNSGTYHKTLYVIGDNVTTNGTKDGNGQYQNHSLGTYTLPITIQTKTSDSASATTDDNVNGNGTFKPQITGRVGSSMIISPSDFLDDGQLQAKDSKLTTDNYGLYSGDHQYRITFGTGGNLTIGQINPTDPGNSKADSSISGNPVFTYVGNENGANKSTSKKHAIRVNYLYRDMNHVNGQTPSQKWIQIPNTTVSDHGKSGDQWNSGQIVQENVPKGYQFVKILNVNPTAQEEGHSYHNGDNVNAYDATAHGTSESALNNTVKDLKFGNSDQTINIAVIPTAGDVTVEYYNQNGKALNSDGNISDNPSKDIISGNSSSTNNVGAYSRYGQTIDLAHGNNPRDSQGVSYGLKNVPAGYHLVQNPMTDPSDGYQFTRQPQTIKLTVVGNDVTQNSSKNEVTVQVHKVPGNGHTDHGNISDTTYAHGRIGNKSYLDPNDYAPAGYHATPSDHPWEVDFSTNGSATHNGKSLNTSVTPSDGTTNKNEPDWNYIANNPNEKPFYFNVTYVNEKNGQPVSNKDRVNGYYGENISDVTQYAGLPLGYTVDESNNGGKPYSYKLGFGKAAQNGGNVDVPVEGIGADQSNVGNLKFTVYSVYKSKNGQERISDKTKTLNDWHSYNHNINANGTSIGDTFTVKPSDYKPSGEEYSVDKADVPETVQVLPNGNGATLSTDQAVFYYDDNHSDSKDEAAPIVVHYINKNNGHQVGTNDVINGKYNSTAISISKGVIAHASDPDANWSVPDGYTASDAADTGTYSFGSDIQNVYLPVEGKQVSDKLTVYQIKEDQSDTQLGDAVAHSKALSGKVGDTFTISPYSDVPSNDKYSQNGYHADNSDDDVNVTLGTDGHILLNGIDHLTNNNSYGISYVYRPNVSSKTDDTLDTITIHYKDASNPNGNDIDTEYDHSTTGKPFDITPYENDIPSNVSNNYYYYDAADTTNTSNNPSININSFKDGSETNSNGGQPNNQDVYIYVEKNNGSANGASGTTGGPNADGPDNQF